MKASELMIGDLVYVRDDIQRVIQIGEAGCTVLPAEYPYFEMRSRSTKSDKILKLLGIGTNTIGYYHESEITPILLTEEILKANGAYDGKDGRSITIDCYYIGVKDVVLLCEYKGGFEISVLTCATRYNDKRKKTKMTKEQFEELKQTIHDANLRPIQRICCFLCDHCDTYKEYPLRSHCNLHHYDLLDPHEGVCFQYRPFRKE